MRFQRLRSKISELQEITNTWQESTPISSLEMDMALDRIKQIYEILRFESAGTGVNNNNVVVEAAADNSAEMITEATVGLVETVDNDLDNDNIRAEKETIEESIEITVERESVETISGGVKLNKRERYNRILSLYGDEGDESEAAEEKSVSDNKQIVTPAANETYVKPRSEISELSEQSVKLESESESKSKPEPELKVGAKQKQPIATSKPLQSMSIQLTLNDRFLLSHDLFDGDMETLNLTLVELDGQPSYEDAIIFIAENYSWDGNSAGAQILITLLKNRFSLN